MMLFWSPLSPYVRKVMIVAHEAGLADRIQCIDTQVSMSAVNHELLPHNPLAQIPVMVLADGETLHDSRVICEYLDALGERGLFPALPHRWGALKRQAIGDGMLDALIVWRQERLKPANRRTQEWHDSFATKIGAALDQLQRDVASLAAAPFDIGHIAIGSALGYLDFRFADLEWRAARAGLADWHAEFESRPAARATTPGVPS